jgi:hypothetical protein
MVQCFDGAANMSGLYNGLQAKIRECAPMGSLLCSSIKSCLWIMINFKVIPITLIIFPILKSLISLNEWLCCREKNSLQDESSFDIKIHLINQSEENSFLYPMMILNSLILELFYQSLTLFHIFLIKKVLGFYFQIW